jgi:pimeloyl-ACP methyl ester carboxylesterase
MAGERLRVHADVGLASGHARLFAVDLPGFGASERREDLLSPRAMGGFLAQLIDEADLGTPHIVAPDVGAAAALFAAAAYPERMATVTVGTGGAAVPIQLGEPLASAQYASAVLDSITGNWP